MRIRMSSWAGIIAHVSIHGFFALGDEIRWCVALRGGMRWWDRPSGIPIMPVACGELMACPGW